MADMMHTLQIDEVPVEDLIVAGEEPDEPYWKSNGLSGSESNIIDPNSVPVDCFSMTGVLLYRFSSLLDVSTCLHVELMKVRSAVELNKLLRGMRFAVSPLPHFHVDWQTKANRIANIKNPSTRGTVLERYHVFTEADPIECYGGNGAFLYRFRDLSDASQSLNIDTDRIRRVCYFEKRHAYGLSFNYSLFPYEERDEEDRNKRIKKIKDYRDKVPNSVANAATKVKKVTESVAVPVVDETLPMECYTMSWDMLFRFRNLEDAAMSLSVDASLIRKVCLKQRKSVCGLKFRTVHTPYEEMEEEIKAASIQKVKSQMRRGRMAAAAAEKKSQSDDDSDSEHSSGSGYCITQPIGDRYESSLRRRLRRSAEADEYVPQKPRLGPKFQADIPDIVIPESLNGPFRLSSVIQPAISDSVPSSSARPRDLEENDRYACEDNELYWNEEAFISNVTTANADGKRRNKYREYEEKLRRKAVDEEKERNALYPNTKCQIMPDLIHEDHIVCRKVDIAKYEQIYHDYLKRARLRYLRKGAIVPIKSRSKNSPSVQYVCILQDYGAGAEGEPLALPKVRLPTAEALSHEMGFTIVPKKRKPPSPVTAVPNSSSSMYWSVDTKFEMDREEDDSRLGAHYTPSFQQDAVVGIACELPEKTSAAVKDGTLDEVDASRTLTNGIASNASVVNDPAAVMEVDKVGPEESSVDSLADREEAEISPVATAIDTPLANDVTSAEIPVVVAEPQTTTLEENAVTDAIVSIHETPVVDVVAETQVLEVQSTEALVANAPTDGHLPVKENQSVERESSTIIVSTAMNIDEDCFSSSADANQVSTSSVDGEVAINPPDVPDALALDEVIVDSSTVSESSTVADFNPGSGIAIDVDNAPSAVIGEGVQEAVEVVSIPAEAASTVEDNEVAAVTQQEPDITMTEPEVVVDEPSEYPLRVMVYNGRDILYVRVEDFVINSDDDLIQLLVEAGGDQDAAIVLLDEGVAKKIDEQFSLAEVQAYLKGVEEFKKDMQIFRRTPLLKKKSYKSLVNFHYKFYWFSVPNLSEVIIKAMLLNVFRCADSTNNKQSVVKKSTSRDSVSPSVAVSDSASTASDVDKGAVTEAEKSVNFSSDTTVPMVSSADVPAPVRSNSQEAMLQEAAATVSEAEPSSADLLVKRLTSPEYDLITAMKSFIITSSNNRRSMSPATTESVLGDDKRSGASSKKARGRPRSSSGSFAATNAETSENAAGIAAKKQKTSDTMSAGKTQQDKKKPGPVSGANRPIVTRDVSTNDICFVYRNSIHCGAVLNLKPEAVLALCRAPDGENVVGHVKLTFYDGPKLNCKLSAGQLETATVPSPKPGKPPLPPSSRKRKADAVTASASSASKPSSATIKSGITVIPPNVWSVGVSPEGREKPFLKPTSVHHVLVDLLRNETMPLDGLNFQQLMMLINTTRPELSAKSESVQKVLDNLLSLKLVKKSDEGNYRFVPPNSPALMEWLNNQKPMTTEQLEQIVDENNVVGWLIQLMKQCASHTKFQVPFFKSLLKQVANLPEPLKLPYVNLQGVVMIALNKGVNMKLINLEVNGAVVTYSLSAHCYKLIYPVLPVSSLLNTVGSDVTSTQNRGTSSSSSASAVPPRAKSGGSSSTAAVPLPRAGGSGGSSSGGGNNRTIVSPRVVYTKKVQPKTSSSSSSSSSSKPTVKAPGNLASLTALAADFFKEKELLEKDLQTQRLKEAFDREKEELRRQTQCEGASSSSSATASSAVVAGNQESQSLNDGLSQALFEDGSGVEEKEQEEELYFDQSLFDAYGL